MIYKDADQQLHEFIASVEAIIDVFNTKQKQLKKEKADQQTKDHYARTILLGWFNNNGEL